MALLQFIIENVFVYSTFSEDGCIQEMWHLWQVSTSLCHGFRTHIESWKMFLWFSCVLVAHLHHLSQPTYTWKLFLMPFLIMTCLRNCIRNPKTTTVTLVQLLNPLQPLREKKSQAARAHCNNTRYKLCKVSCIDVLESFGFAKDAFSNLHLHQYSRLHVWQQSKWSLHLQNKLRAYIWTLLIKLKIYGDIYSKNKNTITSNYSCDHKYLPFAYNKAFGLKV